MKRIIYLFLMKPVTGGMLFFSAVILGFAAMKGLTLELSPDVEYPRLSVSAAWHGVAPEAVEAFLTSPLEASLSTVKGISKISSSSYEGYTVINLEFQPETDMDFARVEINEKLSMLKKDLTAGASPPFLSSYVPEDFRELQGFLTYTIASDKTANELNKYAREKLIIPLMAVQGVSKVSVRGGNEREINILIDYDKAKLYNISNHEIDEAVRNASMFVSAGALKKRERQTSVQVDNLTAAAESIRMQPVIRIKDGTVIKLKDIGIIKDDFRENTNYYRINGKEAVTLVIDKEAGANTIETADRVFAKLKELQPFFPDDFTITKEMDRSEDIRNELDELMANGIYSFVIIIVLLAIIFRRFAYPLIIILSIAFSLLSTFLLFYLFNISLNIITIASLVLGFGLMVDNSIVVIDYLDRHYTGRGIKHLSVYTREVFPPVFASSITTIAVFIPLLFLTGELRLYFQQFALAITFAIGASLIISFTLIPSLYLKYGRRKQNTLKESESPIVLKFYEIIQRIIFTWKKTAIFLIILLIGLPVWLLPEQINTQVIGGIYNNTIGSKFYTENRKYINYALGGTGNLFFNYIPKGKAFSLSDRASLSIRLQLPQGNDINIINNLTKRFEAEILVYRDRIKDVVTNVYDKETAYINIEFTPEQSMSAFPYMLKNYLSAYATQLGGLSVSVWGYGMGFSNGGFGGSSPFNIQVKGFNYQKVKELAEEFKNRITKNPRISNVDIDKGFYGDDNTYEVVGKIRRDKLAQYDIDLQALFGIIANSALGNVSASVIQIGDEEVNYNIKFSNYEKVQLQDINEMIIRGGGKSAAKVKDILDFDRKKTPGIITREDRQYVRYVGFEYKGPYEYGQKFVEKTAESMQIPPGYEIITKHEFSFFDKKEEIEIWSILGLSMLLIFMITAGLFESYKKPLLIISAIPFAFIGVIFTYFFFDLTLDRGAYAGVLLLIGISVNNSIVLVDYISHNVRKNELREIIRLSYNRIRPIMTTTFTTLAALLPIILFGTESFWKNLSYSVAGGLLISAVFTLIFLPLFYYMINKNTTAKRDIV